jgi:VanZ family protein
VKALATRIARITGWLLVVVITVLSLVPAWLRPDTGVPHKLEHFAIFALTGFAFGLGYNRRFLLATLWLVFFTGAIELAQFLVPGRHARLMDFVVDVLAICVSAAAGKVIASQASQSA